MNLIQDIAMRFAPLLSASLLLVACAHEPPAELVNARAAFQSAAAGPAATLVPAELHKAEMALKSAEIAFDDEPRSYHTLDLAYVAQRKAQLAHAHALVASSEAASKKAKADFDATMASRLTASQDQLAATQTALATTSTNLDNTTANLATSEKGRAEADARAAAAVAELAAAKEEARGLVITLSGSVLFRSNESILLPEAQTRLGQVADALLTKPTRALIIEGHTDSRGDDAANLQLSQARAEAVRTFLGSRGYDPALIRAQGIGEARPIADNTTPEGMANNRRVEIVITR